MSDYRAPGVYIEEQSNLPMSVAGAATAVPVFIGMTLNCPDDCQGTPVKIASLLEYEKLFGRAPAESLNVKLTAIGQNPIMVKPNSENNKLKQIMYYNLQLFFSNGGGVCYIVPLGEGDAKDADVDDYKNAIDSLEKKPDITLLVLTDAAYYLDAPGDVYTSALEHCKKMQNRFVIVDVQYVETEGQGALEAGFKDWVGTQYLDYAAAYTPYLNTSLGYHAQDELVDISCYEHIIEETLRVRSWGQKEAPGIAVAIDSGEFEVKPNSLSLPASPEKVGELLSLWSKVSKKYSFELASVVSEMDAKGFGHKFIDHENSYIHSYDDSKSQSNLQDYTGESLKLGPAPICHDGLQILLIADGSTETKVEVISKEGPIGFTKAGMLVTISCPANSSNEEILQAWAVFDDTHCIKELITLTASEDNRPLSLNGLSAQMEAQLAKTISDLASTQQDLYHKIKAVIKKQTITNFPPSGAMAGVYASIDKKRGVWQSPANVSLNGVLAPSFEITEKQQETLNIDATNGKSINAIRSFPGKGTLVWGARTLAGNDNNWRYIGVRRLFIYAESSIRNALQTFVFEPNTSMTWLKVRAMLESFLEDLWQQGGLAGSTAKDAFYVNIGLGTTMTNDDILDGRMKVSIGLAAVRPAEFIVVEFSQLLQK